MKLSLGITPRDYSVIGGASYDADAQAYFTANTSITNPADKTAINDFYLGLKTDSIYSKIKVMNMPIWGSAASCKWNLVNPLDTDAAFRSTYSTGFTFSSSGTKGNAVSAYSKLFFTPSIDTTINNLSFGFYSTSSRIASASKITMGSSNGSDPRCYLQAYNSNALRGGINQTGNSSFSVGSSTGQFHASRINGTQLILGRNNSFSTITVSSTTVVSNSFAVWANQSAANTFAGYDDLQLSFIYVANGLTTSELSLLDNRINSLMTYFGINTY